MEKEPVSCLASSRVQANRIVNHLINAGFSYGEISVLFPCGPGFGSRNSDEKAGPQPTALATPDWEVGGALGWLAELGSFALPRVGRFLVAGPLSAALGGPTATLSTDALVDALRSLGVSRHDARYYVESVKMGGTLVSFAAGTPDEAVAARRIFHAIGAGFFTGAGKTRPQLSARTQLAGNRPEYDYAY